VSRAVRTDVVLVAATERELCGFGGLVCGIGPVEAAATTVEELTRRGAAALVHVGIAGGRGLQVGTIVVGADSVYCDLSAAIPTVARVEPDAELLALVRAALPTAPSLTIGTSAAVAGPCALLSPAPDVEAMEGFAVLRAAARAGVPAVEVRAISNEIGEDDRTRWRVDDALEAVERALPALLAAASSLRPRDPASRS
jgi:futalosine hydrolase